MLAKKNGAKTLVTIWRMSVVMAPHAFVASSGGEARIADAIRLRS
jgi:hypothetical protein